MDPINLSLKIEISSEIKNLILCFIFILNIYLIVFLIFKIKNNQLRLLLPE